MKKIISTTEAPAAIGPYSQAVITNGMLYASGQIPIDPKSGNVVSGDITEETRRVMQNVGAILSAAGLDYTDVIKTTVFLTDLGDFTTVNSIYAEYFVEPYPARSCVEVKKLPKGVNIEVEITAKLRD